MFIKASLHVTVSEEHLYYIYIRNDLEQQKKIQSAFLFCGQARFSVSQIKHGLLSWKFHI